VSTISTQVYNQPEIYTIDQDAPRQSRKSSQKDSGSDYSGSRPKSKISTLTKTQSTQVFSVKSRTKSEDRRKSRNKDENSRLKNQDENSRLKNQDENSRSKNRDENSRSKNRDENSKLKHQDEKSRLKKRNKPEEIYEKNGLPTYFYIT